MKRILLLFVAATLLFSCEKEEKKSYLYWSNLVSEKHAEINTLTQSVSCTDIEEFEIVNRSGYFMVHLSIMLKFDQLMVELEQLQSEAGKAATREGILNDMMWSPNPPVRKVCADGKPKLIFAQNLSLEEVNEELPIRLEELENFYNDITCTNADEWTGYFLRAGCCMQGIAIHKTIRTAEMFEKVHIYNRLMERKLSLEKMDCKDMNCPNEAKPVQCIDGKPVIEMTSS
ncbi:MAG TPA: hypothetical protein PKA53_01835 [Sphingobacterium sp.]|nr:hypothetical protein [Sphingobacterium sp.]